MNNNYIHHIPGRVRVRMPEFKANAKGAQEFQARMQQRPGVASVEINLLTGSVLVHYDGSSVTAQLLHGLLQRRGAWPTSEVAGKTVTRLIGQKVFKVAVTYVLNVAIEQVFTATLPILL